MEDKQKRRSRASSVRETDLEPYTALRWVGTIFKAAAIFLVVAIAGEMVAGLRIEGAAALPILLGELARTVVLAVVLWGAGDLARLLIHIGHDIRAERIILGRIGYRLRSPGAGGEDELDPAEAAADADADAAAAFGRTPERAGTEADSRDAGVGDRPGRDRPLG